MKNKIHLLLILFLSISVHSQIIEVGPKKEIKSIKKAIALAKAGDTILVHKGTYREGNIIIDKKIILLGKDYPVLDGEKKHEILSIKTDSIIIKGLKFIRSSYASMEDPAAIKVYSSNFITIENNILDDNFFGIYIQNGTNCLIKNNKIRAYGKEEQKLGNGIHCWKSNDIQIIANNIQGHRDGIYFEFVFDSVIWRNISQNNIRYGLHFMFSHNDSYITNTFRNNGAGVAVMYSKEVKMMNNLFDQNWGQSAYALLLKEINDSYILGNKFTKNTVAVHMEGSNRIKFEKNLFQENGWAMKVQASCGDNEITRNNFVGNTFDMGTNGSLVLNSFNENYWDKYEGYDLDKNGIGDVPYHPLSLFAVLSENTPSTMLLYRSFMITLLDKSEKILPSITPDNFIDNKPLMKMIPG
ncbi:nitrous oxide reductase family maturation protein NosD [Flavobacterium sediminilitoris]|uniref:Nitrous oxide reductase family maturation protein NosD n=1 Tax=Flavobacterium sediminilitoris TaxID=2024526 RepID=A0ABY4HKU1_9FLAO|nr:MULTISPECIES: nitrous oxide reductase family maturation protein NosD [Flavobacterium]UOX33477.1 nitrous oxide reductase family maturation protein NosD [Flavobacterium sediminilitoris]